MQPARRHVGGHQDRQVALLELIDQFLALRLRQVADDELGVAAVHGQPARHLLGGVLGVGEDQRAFGLLLLQQPEQQAELLLLGDVVEALRDGVYRHPLRLDGDLGRLAHVPPRQVAHPAVQGGAGQHRPALLRRRHPAQDLAHVRHEAHVEQAVRLVDHQGADVRQRHLAGTVEVEQPARRGDEDVHALAQGSFLFLVANASVHAGHLEVEVRAEQLRLLLDLHRQLAGGDDDERESVVEVFLLEEQLEDRDQERGGLAGSGLGLHGHVDAFQGVLEGTLLDFRAFDEPGVADSVLDPRIQVEVGELHRFV